MSEFDDLAENYDATRGGEGRGDEYAADIDGLIPPGEAPILEVGVGTGVVALGLVRRGRPVLGLDISAPMIARARARLGPVVVRSDAMAMAIADASVAHALSVWVVHSVRDPVLRSKKWREYCAPAGLTSCVRHKNPLRTTGSARCWPRWAPGSMLAWARLGPGELHPGRRSIGPDRRASWARPTGWGVSGWRLRKMSWRLSPSGNGRHSASSTKRPSRK
jgi:SAM-dependent methyltransferase